MPFVYAELIGDPAGPGPATFLHRYWLHKTGLNAEYRTRCLPTGNFMDGMSGLQDHLARARQDGHWRGCTILPPLKEAAAALVDRRRPMAARLGSVDLILRDGGLLVGCNSAAIGFVAPLLDRLATLPSRHALLVGAGCLARTIAHMLDDLGLTLVIANRSLAAAARLVAELGRKDRHRAVALDAIGALAEGFGLLVNATPLGAVGRPPLALPLDALAPGAIVYDLVRDPPETALLQAAKARALTRIDGMEMLLGQASMSFEGLYGVAAPRVFDDQVRLLLVP